MKFYYGLENYGQLVGLVKLQRKLVEGNRMQDIILRQIITLFIKAEAIINTHLLTYVYEFVAQFLNKKS